MDQAADTPAAPNPKGVPHRSTQLERRDLRPLPLRVAETQYQRLVSARARTGISVQEHVRRAIDWYLAQIEREAIELAQIAKVPLPKAPKPKNKSDHARPATGARAHTARVQKR